jgi:triosephosphate isomerase
MRKTGENMAANRFLIAGNWKMNGLAAEGLGLARAINDHATGPGAADCDLLVCPPATLLRAVFDALAGGPVSVGGQDCHTAVSGSYTGSISAAMLADAGARSVIVGHSERRHGLGETDALVADKVRAAHAAGLIAIVCIGETEADRDAGRTLDVLATQIAGSLPDDAMLDPARTVIAYEPVWAIGTGRTPTREQVAEAHAHMRRCLTDRVGGSGAAIRLLYGGSVKPDNATELMAVADVDGALVGGASLNARDFCAIALAAASTTRA